ncbi:hypothetical protein CoNPh26_CDS0092 [Staphylococcus phage S-CoN_Ph26]|nr:hypothetical protein CoNPh26_CDS0092 [Staphylococcus phage S-CoN_Ph26]
MFSHLLENVKMSKANLQKPINILILLEETFRFAYLPKARLPRHDPTV